MAGKTPRTPRTRANNSQPNTGSTRTVRGGELRALGISDDSPNQNQSSRRRNGRASEQESPTTRRIRHMNRQPAPRQQPAPQQQRVNNQPAAQHQPAAAQQQPANNQPVPQLAGDQVNALFAANPNLMQFRAALVTVQPNGVQPGAVHANGAHPGPGGGGRGGNAADQPAQPGPLNPADGHGGHGGVENGQGGVHPGQAGGGQGGQGGGQSAPPNMTENPDVPLVLPLGIASPNDFQSYTRNFSFSVGFSGSFDWRVATATTSTPRRVAKSPTSRSPSIQHNETQVQNVAQYMAALRTLKNIELRQMRPRSIVEARITVGRYVQMHPNLCEPEHARNVAFLVRDLLDGPKAIQKDLRLANLGDRG
ncbi:hypothetical protein M409DRAFT_28834 [Zasmidium cellare ATCC 36951]|uniref:Uncharacterized protein n=1 Tax=Zasmidium cellare ATCC 36951 TaxID=1080233 RepID=A0A6A6C0Y3_ZASCE|nr:uncharacterized protein M409DRAFT_28834 [Zasmidium cellare ATCC 36951]KAF2160694.1 hypothetical protein M409DRAFT_28834 [Zasmidium cellare ATCC 36951]